MNNQTTEATRTLRVAVLQFPSENGAISKNIAYATPVIKQSRLKFQILGCTRAERRKY